MTIHLPKELESSIIANVHGGLFPSLDAAMTEAVRLRLDRIEQRQTQPEAAAPAPMPVWQQVLKNMEAVPGRSLRSNTRR